MRMRGFTLIELLATLVILAMLTTAAAPMMQLTAKRAKEQELRRALWQIRDAIDAYKRASDEGVIFRSDEKSGYPPSLQVLTQGLENLKDPKRRKLVFLRRVPRDPFYPDPEASDAETWQVRSYVRSFAETDARGWDATPAEDVYDVRSTSDAIGLNGRPYREW